MYTYPVSSLKWIWGHQTFTTTTQELVLQQWLFLCHPAAAKRGAFRAQGEGVPGALPADSGERGILTGHKSLLPLQNAAEDLITPRDTLEMGFLRCALPPSVSPHPIWDTLDELCLLHHDSHMCFRESHLGTSSCVPTQPILPGFSCRWCPWLAASRTCPHTTSETGRCSHRREALVRLSST